MLLPVSAWAEPKVLKFATTLPASSAYARRLTAMDTALRKVSEGGLAVTVQASSSAGDEAAQLAKIKAGELDGALVTTVGLSSIEPLFTLLKMPGVYSDWRKFQSVRSKYAPQLTKSLNAAGLTNMGWVDFGFERVISRGFAARLPSDLKGKRLLVSSDDAVSRAIAAAAHATPVVMSKGDVTGGLAKLDALGACPSDVVSMKWAARFDHANSQPGAPVTGAFVISTAKLNSLDRKTRETLTSLMQRAFDQPSNEASTLVDQHAAAGLNGVFESTPQEAEAWRVFYQGVRQRLAQGPLTPEVVTDIEALIRK